MADLQDLERMKKKVSTLKTEVDKGKGRLEESMKTLQKKFKVPTLKEAQALLVKLTDGATKAGNKFNTAMTKFEEAWDKREEAEEE
jgi:hypothetical protein